MMDCSIDNPTTCPESNKAGEHCYINSDNQWRCLPKKSALTKAMSICEHYENGDKVWDEAWKACRRVWEEYQKTMQVMKQKAIEAEVEKDRQRVNTYIKELDTE